MQQATEQRAITKWKIDPQHSEIGFRVKHMMVTTVRGIFQQYDAEIELDEQDPTRSTVSVEIDVASLDTRTAQRDDHLRSADFFDVANHPKLTFKSRSIQNVAGKYRIAGDLTIRGVTREVVLDAELTGRGKDPWGGERIGATSTAHIDRGDFGLTWNVALETGGVLVAREVTINLDLELVRQ